MKLGLKGYGVIAATSALAISGVITVASTGASASTKLKTYEIGYQGPLSGGNAATGLYEKYGAQLAVNKWNHTKGIKFKIKLVPGDDQGDPTIAPSVATGFVLNPRIMAIVGPAFSGATVASLAIYGANHVAMVSPSATRVSITVKDPTASPTGPLNTYHNFFRVVANDGVQGPADGKYLQKHYGTGKILVISDTSTYGAGLATAVANAVTAASGSLANGGSILNLPYSNACTAGGTGTSDAVTANLSGVSAIFYAGYYCDFAQVVDNLVGTQHYSGAIMSGDGSDEPQFITSLSTASDGNGVLLTCACSNNQSAAWTAAFTAVAHEAPGPYSAESYDATNLVMRAMTKVLLAHKKMTRANVLAQIKKITFKGITKVIKFNSAGDISGSAIFVNKVESGKIVQLGLE
ncbi:MAG TPA: branched-chain amino acid ABC transporter substrate-binding protein [Acidimicrobiales bacterium]|nr:branched-chain amino acid ABC transporter substrate-binding protein [Acidimicrobiales bacterium]